MPVHPDIAGTGSMVADAIYLTSRIIGPEEKALLLAHGDGAAVHRFVGGVTLNHLGWARLLGLEVAIFGKQADDEAGRFLRAGMERAGIRAHLDLSGGASSEANIFVAPDGGRAIYMARGATGDFTPEEVDADFGELIDQAPMVTTEISQLPLATVKRVLERARAAGARTVVDFDVPLVDAVPALGSREELEEVLGLTDVLKPSLAAMEGFVDTSSPEATARALASTYGCRLVAITDGERGSTVLAGDTLAHVPSVAIEVVDTTGAGDAFLGGFVAGLRLGLDPVAAARLGNACGATCCERLGAFPEDAEACRARILQLHQAMGGQPLCIDVVDTPPPSLPALETFCETAATEVSLTTQDLDRAAVAAAADLIAARRAQGSRVHVTGVGKPAYVAGYVASLLSSTGTPATFLHGTEATHGSVGQLEPGDVVIAISNSGGTRQLVASARAAVGRGAHLVAVTGGADSELADLAEVVLLASVASEGGPLGLAPRASVLNELVVLMALSVALQERRGLDREQYHARHPAGALGTASAGPT